MGKSASGRPRFRNFTIVRWEETAQGVRMQLRETDGDSALRLFEAELGVMLDLAISDEGFHPVGANIIRHYIDSESEPWWPNSTSWDKYGN